MDAIIRWFKNYKTFDGKPVNKIHFNESILDVQKTVSVIHENHQYWIDLKASTQRKEASENGKAMADIAHQFYFH